MSRLNFFYSQMKHLHLGFNDIDDDGAVMLLGCLSNVKRLTLRYCSISFEMQAKLYERGREDGCEVNCYLTKYNSKLANSMNFKATQ